MHLSNSNRLYMDDDKTKPGLRIHEARDMHAL